MTIRIFITGEAHGIGKSIVEAFASRGDKVAFCDIDAVRGEAISAQTGAAYYKVDVTDATQLETAMQQVFDAWGDIDMLVNNVGIGMFKPLTEVPLRQALKKAGITCVVTTVNPRTKQSEQHPICDVASSHMARRTFIGNLYKKVKDSNLVGKLSGHWEGSKAFVRYRDTDDDMIKEMTLLLD